MDLRLFLSVLARFRRQVIGGAVLAVVCATLAYGSPGWSHGTLTFNPHTRELWHSEAELLITQLSFPYGHAEQQYLAGAKNTPAVLVGDQGYMASLGPIYVALANGDTVQSLVRSGAPKGTSMHATEVLDVGTDQPMPLIALTASASSPSDAAHLARRATRVLREYVAAQQAGAQIPVPQRVQLQVVKTGDEPTLAQGHKLTQPILILMVVLALSVAAAFVRENLDPRVRRSGAPHLDGDRRVGEENGSHVPDGALAEGLAGVGNGSWRDRRQAAIAAADDRE